jgi:hypothetical protein
VQYKVDTWTTKYTRFRSEQGAQQRAQELTSKGFLVVRVYYKPSGWKRRAR